RESGCDGGRGAWSASAASTPLQRNVPMLLRRVAVSLGRESGERLDQAGPRVPRVDDVVQVPAGRGLIGMRELLTVLVGALVGGVLLVEAFHGPRRARPRHRRRRTRH